MSAQEIVTPSQSELIRQELLEGNPAISKVAEYSRSQGQYWSEHLTENPKGRGEMIARNPAVFLGSLKSGEFNQLSDTTRARFQRAGEVVIAMLGGKQYDSDTFASEHKTALKGAEDLQRALYSGEVPKTDLKIAEWALGELSEAFADGLTEAETLQLPVVGKTKYFAGNVVGSIES